jgi:hypothetical protein
MDRTAVATLRGDVGLDVVADALAARCGRLSVPGAGYKLEGDFEPADEPIFLVRRR